MDHVFKNYHFTAPVLYVALSAVWLDPIDALELYRCTLNGEIEFRQTPCPAGDQEVTEVVEQSRGMTPIEPSLRLKDKPKSRKEKPVKRTGDEYNKEKCWKTKKKLEKVEQRLRGGYKPSQSQSLHNSQSEYEEYLRLFCP